MRYIEQLRYSWNYYWGIFREIWDILTGELHWWVVGFLGVFCVMPIFFDAAMADVDCYVNTPKPPFNPSIPQDISYELAMTNYCSKVKSVPSIPVVVNYYWVRNGAFEALTKVLCLASIGSLLGAHLREGSCKSSEDLGAH